MTDIEVGMMFEHVKKLLPSFHTDTFITDDTNTFWNGFSKVFPSSKTKRLCLWHVQQAMKKNANAKLVNVSSLRLTPIACSWNGQEVAGKAGILLNQRDLCEPFLRKVRYICLVREGNVVVTQDT
ncbi:hypothetical protein RB195_022904 [Necator americanus]|uniref:MULE transposase domain-containing protein n=1 Tax=Necator americanus TaxID=51031 RepID=A0ABR1EH18_NECAM